MTGCEFILNHFGVKGEGCCDSCHDDMDHGFDDGIEYTVDGKVYRVCCSVSNAVISEKNLPPDKP